MYLIWSGCPLIPKGEPHALNIRPPWKHILPGHYGDKEVISDDAHDANQKKNGICVGIKKCKEIWESGYLENETYCKKKWGMMSHARKMLLRNWIFFFPQCPTTSNLVFGHQHQTPHQIQVCLTLFKLSPHQRIISQILSMQQHATNQKHPTILTQMFTWVILFVFYLWTSMSTMCGWAEHSMLCKSIAAIPFVENFKFNIEGQANKELIFFLILTMNITKGFGIVNGSAIYLPLM